MGFFKCHHCISQHGCSPLTLSLEKFSPHELQMGNNHLLHFAGIIQQLMSSFFYFWINRILSKLGPQIVQKEVPIRQQHFSGCVCLLDNMTKMVAEHMPMSASDSLSSKDDTPVKRLWFTDFQAKGNNVGIKGIAMDSKTVADFMTRLENSKFYENVNLKTLKQQKITTLNLKNFDITCIKISLNNTESKK